MVKKLSELYLEARRAFMTQEDADTASMLARNLLCHVTGKSKEEILAQRELYAGEQACEAMADAVSRVLGGEPLAYVLGCWEFFGLPLYVTKDVLIPRDDTCAVTELAIEQAKTMENPRILDLCTGSGCIGLAIASCVPSAKVTCADISQKALAIAKKNITNLKLTSRVTCVRADALAEPSPFLGKFDLVVSNPPYITGPEMLDLPHSVKDFEPHLALYGGLDGLDFYRNIATQYAAVLKPGAYLCFEFGMGQGDGVCRILEENGYTVLKRTKDYNERERAVMARYDRKD